MSADLWAAYARGEPGAREQLLAEHLGLVNSIARQVVRGLSTEAELDDLVSSGTIGLMTAMDSFDSSRGIAFSTYATPRIRGAMLDELRQLDHVPRSVRRKIRTVGRARAELMRALGRMPNDREIATQLGIHVDTLWRWQAEAEGSTVLRLEHPSQEGDSARGPGVLFDTRARSADEQLNQEQEIGLLKGALLALGEQDRTVLSLYYYEELKLHEIAAIVGLTESRISQVRSRALARLRAALDPARSQPRSSASERPREDSDRPGPEGHRPGNGATGA